jgi:AraC-like DNA-binding protein
VLSQLTKSILPHIGREGSPSPLSADYLQLLLGADLLQRYGQLQRPPRRTHAGLGPRQQRRALELLEENLGGRVRLSDLAHECGLSISHFGRSFKVSFGMSAHRWLVHRRVERTKALMTQTNHSPTLRTAWALPIRPRSREHFGKSSVSARDGGGGIMCGPAACVPEATRVDSKSVRQLWKPSRPPARSAPRFALAQG